MEANAGKSFQMQIFFNIFPRISLDCKLVPVQYWEYEYGLFFLDDNKQNSFENLRMRRRNRWDTEKETSKQKTGTSK